MDATKEIRNRINALAAHLAVLEHLVLAMYASGPEREHIRQNYLDTTERQNVEGIYSNMPESFLDEFAHCREVIDQLLQQAMHLPAKPGG